MTKKMHRREFLSQTALAGVSAVLGPKALAGMNGGTTDALRGAAPIADVAVASGTDAGAMTLKAVELVGGIGKFVAKGARVALLPNVQSKNPGTFTKPEILRAVIRMCKKAGAKESSIYPMKAAGAHPSATCRIGVVIDKNLETQIKDLYCCDASVFPSSLGAPVVWTVVSLGKRLSKHLDARLK